MSYTVIGHDRIDIGFEPYSNIVGKSIRKLVLFKYVAEYLKSL